MNNTTATYQPESPDELFAQLLQAIELVPQYQKLYKRMNSVLQECLNQQTADVAFQLCGTFAKTDYLLKERGADAKLSKAVNNTRHRLRKHATLDDAVLEKYYLTDFRNLCLFVAFTSRCEVPRACSRRFPTIVVDEEKSGLLMDEYLRVIVRSWSNDTITVLPESSTDGAELTLSLDGLNEGEQGKWNYLTDMMSEGTQLNLIRPRMKGGRIQAELIILEPDYLVNVSSIAKCFTNYAESHLVNLIHRIEPSPCSEAILLGNLASQMLDEEIHHTPDTLPTYAESAKQFFKSNAVNLLTTPLSNEFHTNAKYQRQHISKAMRQALPESVSRFDINEGIVEPSFYSEMLGLQGRMDYIQHDLRIVIEQKSGKGSFPYNGFTIPAQTEEHYVQLLLYMAVIRYNHHDTYLANNRELHAFLLYSKYEESLLGLGTAPGLLFRALKVRNAIAWADLGYTQPNAYRILTQLTPESLNLKHANNTLWRNYQEPQLTELLLPLHTATELEREYVLRMLTFISNEHVLSKLGNKTKENSGFAATWHDTLEEKLLAGNIYDQLQLLYPTPKTTGNITEVTFLFDDDSDNDIANFRKGDIVAFYPYSQGEEPDIRRVMVYRGTITEILTDTITIQLRASQTDARVFLMHSHQSWAIEHDFMESSYTSLYRGAYSFLSAAKARRDLLLFQRKPSTTPSVQLNGDYGAFNDLMLRVKRANDFFLIIGPPGTGKTSFGLLNTLKEELTEAESSVLLMSYTNRAVDEICSKLVGEGIDFIRLGNSFTCADEYQEYLLDNKVNACPTLEGVRQLFSNTRVVVSTTSTMSSNLALLEYKPFSLAIIDEASQILEPHLLGLLSARHQGDSSIKKFVMIGDHKQLPAVVQQTPDVSVVDDERLQAIHLTDCRLSLFERLLRRYNDNPAVVYMLTHQGRMHHDIAIFPNQTFYGGQLQEVPLPHQVATLPQSTTSDRIGSILHAHRMAFIAVNSEEDRDDGDKVNQAEAKVIASLVRHIYQEEKCDFDENRTIGIIVPYRNQISTVRSAISQLGVPSLCNITIDTVERFQGSQRKYIIYGFTVKRYYQLRFLTSNVFEDFDGTWIDRKLNVAMTRAMSHLMLVGNPTLLARNSIFASLIDFTRDVGAYYEGIE